MTTELNSTAGSRLNCSDLFSLFKSKWFDNAFYWLTPENFEPLQKIAFEMGLRWHTGDTDVSEFRGQRNLVMFPDGNIQGVDIWHPDASYGQPKNFAEMFSEYQSLSFENGQALPPEGAE